MFARYALPAVPFIAVWAGIFLLWLAGRLADAPLPAAVRNTVMAAIVILAIAPGALGSLAFVRAHGTETTQALAWAWMKKSIWPNSVILSEARGLDLPAERYRAEIVSSLAGRDPEAIVSTGVEWIVLSSDAWGPKTLPPGEQAQTNVPEAYAAILARAQAVKVIVPSAQHPGPVIHILRVHREAR
jgi:hypothetical protein